MSRISRYIRVEWLKAVERIEKWLQNIGIKTFQYMCVHTCCIFFLYIGKNNFVNFVTLEAFVDF